MKYLKILGLVLVASLNCAHGATNTALSELTLEQALVLAEQMHPSLAYSRAMTEAAQGRLEQAGKLPNPEAIARTETLGLKGKSTSEADYLVGASQAIPLGNRRSLERTAGQFDLEAQQMRSEANRLEVRQKVHSAFATALFQERAYLTQSQIHQNLAKGVSIAQARVTAGDAVPAEVARTEMELSIALVEARRAEALRDQAKLDLAAAIGDATLVIQSLAGTLDEAFEIPALGQLAGKVASHPAMTAGTAETLAQNARLELAEAQRIPDVKVEVLYRRIESENRNAIDVGLNIPLPIFDRGAGRIREARAEREASRARSQFKQTQLLQDLRSAHVQLTSALAQSEGLKTEVLPRADSILKTAEARYEAGDISLSELLPVRRDWALVQLSYLESLRDTFMAWSQLQAYVVE